MDYIIGKDDFNKNLDDWLFHNEQKNAAFLDKNKAKIPQVFRSYAKKLFRGMTVNHDFMAEVEDKGLVFNTHTSWSKDENVAKKFVNDPSYRVGKKDQSKIKILISKVINPKLQILDIDGYVMYMGVPQLEMQGFDEMNLDSAVKEKEVLISSGVKITKKDIKIL